MFTHYKKPAIQAIPTIPHVITLVWFGNPLSKHYKENIERLKKLHTGYQINIITHSSPKFMAQAAFEDLKNFSRDNGINFD